MRASALVALVVALGGCADLDIKRERQYGAGRSTPPEPEPGLETAAERVVRGEDVVVSRDGTWLVARRCLWARRTLHACEVVFVERERVIGSVPVFDARSPGSLEQQSGRAVHAVEATIARTVGARRVSLSSKLRYGWRDARTSALYTRVVGGDVEVFHGQHEGPTALGRASWFFGDAVHEAYLQSPRAPALVAFALRLQPDAATSYAVFEIDAAGRLRALAIAPPMTPPPGLPRFPTRDEVLALHASVDRALATMPPGSAAEDLRRRFDRLQVEGYLDTPGNRLDLLEVLERLRARIRSAR